MKNCEDRGTENERETEIAGSGAASTSIVEPSSPIWAWGSLEWPLAPCSIGTAWQRPAPANCGHRQTVFLTSLPRPRASSGSSCRVAPARWKPSIPKPALNKYAGMSIDETPYKHVLDSKYNKNTVQFFGRNRGSYNKLFPLQVGYGKRGQSGIEVSDWWPHVSESIDDIAVVRSMWTTDNNHAAQTQFHTGRHIFEGLFPSLGSWVHYGTGLAQRQPASVHRPRRTHSSPTTEVQPASRATISGPRTTASPST